MSDTILTELQDDLVARLSADALFSNITVLSERKDDLVSRINMALGVLTEKDSKIGICAIVMSPIATVEFPNVTRSPMEITLTVRVLENVLFNQGDTGTKTSALTLARRVMRLIHHYHPHGFAQAIVADKPTIVPVPDPLAPLAYEVRFTAQEADVDTYSKVAMPTIGTSGVLPATTVTLATATAGASIYYTTDGTHPWDGNPVAELYSAPFVVNASLTLRVAAVKTDWIASDTNFLKIV